MTYNIKTGKERILGIWITIIRHGRFRPWGSRVMALSIKCDSLALRTESREERIFSSGIKCMSVWEWLEWERKCSETVVGLGLMLILSTEAVSNVWTSVTCPYITDGLISYTFYAKHETRSITSHITCNTKNVVYMVQCNRCNLQSIGETKRRLKDRFNEHKREINPLEKIRSSRDSVRKGRESHLIDKARTLEPHGLNRPWRIIVIHIPSILSFPVFMLYVISASPF